MTVKLDFRITIPKEAYAPAPKPAPAKAIVRIAVNAGDTDCFTDLIKWISNIWQNFLSLFSSDSPIDPERFKKWDAVVEKEYDPVGAPAPYCMEEVNRSRRGKTFADHFVKAVSKTDLNPSFQHVFVYQKGGAGLIFTFDGAYHRCYQRARNGEFNTNKTLIIIGEIDGWNATEREKWLQARIQNTCSDGFPVQNAKFIFLSRAEVSTLQSDRLPSRLLQLLKDSPK